MDCCWCWDKQSGYDLFPGEQPHPFSLPSPLPQWPQGNGFATGRICLGEIEVVQISQFEKIWSCKALFGKSNSVTFYQPVDVPEGFSVLGHYCQLEAFGKLCSRVWIIGPSRSRETSWLYFSLDYGCWL
nr:uncharacterized protein LOC109192363 [Ipomoea batatas]